MESELQQVFDRRRKQARRENSSATDCPNDRESNEANDLETLKRERDAEYKKVHRDKRAQERKLLLLKYEELGAYKRRWDLVRVLLGTRKKVNSCMHCDQWIDTILPAADQLFGSDLTTDGLQQMLEELTAELGEKDVAALLQDGRKLREATGQKSKLERVDERLKEASLCAIVEELRSQIAGLTAENRSLSTRLAESQAQTTTASQTTLHERIDVLLTTIQQKWPTITAQALQGHAQPAALRNTEIAPQFASPTSVATGSSAPGWPAMTSQVQPLTAPQTMLPDFVPPPQQTSSIGAIGVQLGNYGQQPSVAPSATSHQYALHNEGGVYQEPRDIYAQTGMSAHHHSSQSFIPTAMQQNQPGCIPRNQDVRFADSFYTSTGPPQQQFESQQTLSSMNNVDSQGAYHANQTSAQPHSSYNTQLSQHPLFVTPTFNKELSADERRRLVGGIRRAIDFASSTSPSKRGFEKASSTSPSKRGDKNEEDEVKEKLHIHSLRRTPDIKSVPLRMVTKKYRVCRENQLSPYKLLEWDISSGGINFDEDAWINILCSEPLASKKICVVTVTGSRYKTQLFNFLFRYLNHLSVGSKDADTDWCITHPYLARSTKPCIHIAPEVFILPSVDGADVAVLLANFYNRDNDMGHQYSATNIAAFLSLASLMSSVTIRHGQGGKEELTELSEMGRAALSAGAAGIFQRFLFVVDECTFFDESRIVASLMERIQSMRSKQCTNQDSGLFENEADGFSALECCVLTPNAYSQHIEKLRINTLSEAIFAPESLGVKRLRGRPVTCKEYCHWFCECIGRLRARPSASRETKDVVATVYYTTVIWTIIENYKAGLTTAFEQDPVFWQERAAIHETLLAECFEEFDTETKRGSSVFDDLHSYFRSILQSQLNNCYDDFCETLHRVRAYSEEAMARWLNGRH